MSLVKFYKFKDNDIRVASFKGDNYFNIQDVSDILGYGQRSLYNRLFANGYNTYYKKFSFRDQLDRNHLKTMNFLATQDIIKVIPKYNHKGAELINWIKDFDRIKLVEAAKESQSINVPVSDKTFITSITSTKLTKEESSTTSENTSSLGCLVLAKLLINSLQKDKAKLDILKKDCEDIEVELESVKSQLEELKNRSRLLLSDLGE